MRKPISKHALRRALERVHGEGYVQCNAPMGTVVDQLWREIGKKSYHAARRKPVSRESVRTNELLERVETQPEHSS